MEHVVHAPLDLDRVGDVHVAEVEGLVADVLDVLQGAGVEVVQADHLVAIRQQALAQVRAQKTGTAGDDRALHQ